MNIKHPRNFDLRMRILTNQVKMSNVCSMDEDVALILNIGTSA